MSFPKTTGAAAAAGLPPAWSLLRPKSLYQSIYDFAGAPLRMIALPDLSSERLGLTSLRAERFAEVLPRLRGRVLDIGAHDNALLSLYRREAARLGISAADVDASVGVDVVDWGGGCTIVPSSASLPFAEGSFDTVTIIASLNHIPEREATLREARRVLRPAGRIVLTMIGRFIGTVGHALWWYSEEKHRETDEHELMGMDPGEIVRLLEAAGFSGIERRRFGYGLNTVFVAERPR
jgi:SAM-dependent methyltransferase